MKAETGLPINIHVCLKMRNKKGNNCGLQPLCYGAVVGVGLGVAELNGKTLPSANVEFRMLS
jgi:hypothetical protein